MIDFHSHILSHFDDGASSRQESLDMLLESKRQGIDTICSTSHFYPTHESIDHFLKRRQEAYERLQSVLTEECPKVYLGAEVQYFEAITQVENISALKIESSNLLLIEMPFTKWTNRMIEDILELNDRKDIQVILAHVERYMEFNNISVFEQLKNAGIYLQVNASYFLPFLKRNKALKQLKDGLVCIWGSDAHNMENRKPQLGEAFHMIEKKQGKEILVELDNFHHSLFKNNRG